MTPNPSKTGQMTKNITYLSQIKIDKVLGLVGNVTAKVAANNAVPGWAEENK